MGNSSGTCIGEPSTGDEVSNKTATTTSLHQRYGKPAEGNERYAVKVRVYNLQQAGKKGKKHVTTSLGFGFFHSGVEVFGREWNFGGNPNAAPEDCGIFFLPPEMVMPAQQVYDVVTVGYLPLEANNLIIEKAVRETLLPQWTALSYHMLSHNCNHFSEAMITMLNQVFGTKMEFPSFINRAAKFGDVFVPDSILRQMMQQAPQAPTQSSGGKTAGGGGGGANNKKRIGYNPTVTRDGKHYTMGGVPLKDFQGMMMAGGHTGDSGCNCGNPYCLSHRQQVQEDQEAMKEEVALPPIPTEEEMKTMPVKSLKTVMWVNGISWDGCVEKEDLVAAVRRYKEEAAKQ